MSHSTPTHTCLTASVNEDSTLTRRLARIIECAELRLGDAPNLVHAYAACLSDDEICEAVVIALSASPYVRSVLVGQFYSRAESRLNEKQKEAVINRLLEAGEKTPKFRVMADAAISHFYLRLSPATRNRILEAWLGRGTSGADSRWLKAIASDSLLFDPYLILQYWRVSLDSRAARILADRAEPQLLSSIIDELIANLDDDEGSTLSRAVLRVSHISDDVWQTVKQRFPISYLYLCAKLNRCIDNEEAYNLIMQSSPGYDGGRGLAIWSVGQLGMWDVLAKVQEVLQLRVSQTG